MCSKVIQSYIFFQIIFHYTLLPDVEYLGPNAADSTMMLGNYNGDPTHVVTILDGIKAAYPDAEVTYERGCDLVEGFISVPKAPRTGMDMAELARQMGLKAIPSENYSDEARFVRGRRLQIRRWWS